MLIHTGDQPHAVKPVTNHFHGKVFYLDISSSILEINMNNVIRCGKSFTKKTPLINHFSHWRRECLSL